MWQQFLNSHVDHWQSNSHQVFLTLTDECPVSGSVLSEQKIFLVSVFLVLTLLLTIPIYNNSSKPKQTIFFIPRTFDQKNLKSLRNSDGGLSKHFHQKVNISLFEMWF